MNKRNAASRACFHCSSQPNERGYRLYCPATKRITESKGRNAEHVVQARPPSRCHASGLSQLYRELCETFINFVTERANGFRSSGRTLSITGTSPGANSISHSHRSRRNSTGFLRPSPALSSPFACPRCPLLRPRAPTTSRPPFPRRHAPPALSLVLFRKFSAEQRVVAAAARDYHMN